VHLLLLGVHTMRRRVGRVVGTCMIAPGGSCCTRKHLLPGRPLTRALEASSARRLARVCTALRAAGMCGGTERWPASIRIAGTSSSRPASDSGPSSRTLLAACGRSCPPVLPTPPRTTSTCRASSTDPLALQGSTGVQRLHFHVVLMAIIKKS
jgi:hypothetical protein